jgi:hypothetical protein
MRAVLIKLCCAGNNSKATIVDAIKQHLPSATVTGLAVCVSVISSRSFHSWPIVIFCCRGVVFI